MYMTSFFLFLSNRLKKKMEEFEKVVCGWTFEAVYCQQKSLKLFDLNFREFLFTCTVGIVFSTSDNRLPDRSNFFLQKHWVDAKNRRHSKNRYHGCQRCSKLKSKHLIKKDCCCVLRHSVYNSVIPEVFFGDAWFILMYI